MAIALFSFNGEIKAMFSQKVKVIEPTISAITNADGASVVTLINPNDLIRVVIKDVIAGSDDGLHDTAITEISIY
ncbi:hypothetical protein [Acetobacterium tundrae]|uniref:Uncharacterized protein n=1 Tax=Acetobacterium tundrae TaxID=132932 RepID=A0ABR6WM74_9FIRM|nr:hypothetical protein [Acetobacterium tundrae]MBC3797260.1 hypothetical protein [Acetobacterium tundrae]